MSKSPSERDDVTSRSRHLDLVRPVRAMPLDRRWMVAAAILGLVVAVIVVLVIARPEGGDGKRVAGAHCRPSSLRIGVATPVVRPWFDGDPADGSGFEAAFVKELIRHLEIPASGVTYVAAPAEQVFGSGAKAWDIAVSQYRDPGNIDGVRFSRGYLDVPQAVVTTRPGLHPHRLADLRDIRLAALGGSAGEAVASRRVKARGAPTYPSLSALGHALRSGSESAVVVDLPDAAALVRSTPKAHLAGLIRSSTESSELRVVVPADSHFLGCVDESISELKSAGTLKALEKQWLRGRWGAPMLD